MPYNLLTHLILGCSWVWLLGKCKEQTSKRGKRWVTGSCKSTLHITLIHPWCIVIFIWNYHNLLYIYIHTYTILYYNIIYQSFISHFSMSFLQSFLQVFTADVPDHQPEADRTEASAGRNSALPTAAAQTTLGRPAGGGRRWRRRGHQLDLRKWNIETSQWNGKRSSRSWKTGKNMEKCWQTIEL